MPETKLERILLADNDEDVLVALERTLEDRGYATATALSHAPKRPGFLLKLVLTCACSTITCPTKMGFRFSVNSDERE